MEWVSDTYYYLKQKVNFYQNEDCNFPPEKKYILETLLKYFLVWLCINREASNTADMDKHL